MRLTTVNTFNAHYLHTVLSDALFTEHTAKTKALRFLLDRHKDEHENVTIDAGFYRVLINILHAITECDEDRIYMDQDIPIVIRRSLWRFTSTPLTSVNEVYYTTEQCLVAIGSFHSSLMDVYSDHVLNSPISSPWKILETAKTFLEQPAPAPTNQGEVQSEFDAGLLHHGLCDYIFSVRAERLEKYIDRLIERYDEDGIVTADMKFVAHLDDLLDECVEDDASILSFKNLPLPFRLLMLTLSYRRDVDIYSTFPDNLPMVLRHLITESPQVVSAAIASVPEHCCDQVASTLFILSKDDTMAKHFINRTVTISQWEEANPSVLKANLMTLCAEGHRSWLTTKDIKKILTDNVQRLHIARTGFANAILHSEITHPEIICHLLTGMSGILEQLISKLAKEAHPASVVTDVVSAIIKQVSLSTIRKLVESAFGNTSQSITGKIRVDECQDLQLARGATVCRLPIVLKPDAVEEVISLRWIPSAYPELAQVVLKHVHTTYLAKGETVLVWLDRRHYFENYPEVTMGHTGDMVIINGH